MHEIAVPPHAYVQTLIFTGTMFHVEHNLHARGASVAEVGQRSLKLQSSQRLTENRIPPPVCCGPIADAGPRTCPTGPLSPASWMSAAVPRQHWLAARCWPVRFTWNARAVRYYKATHQKPKGIGALIADADSVHRALTSVQEHTRRHHQPAQIGNRRFHVKPSDFLIHEAGPSTTHRDLAPLARRWQLDPEELSGAGLR